MARSYESVRVTIVAAPSHKDAVLLEHDGEEKWVPRSLIDDGFDLDRSDEGTTRRLRIAAWKVEDLGWDR